MLDLLLHKFGFNPADLKRQVDDAAENFNRVIAHFNGRLDIIEKQNKIIIDMLGAVNHDASPASLAIEKLQRKPLLNGESHE